MGDLRNECFSCRFSKSAWSKRHDADRLPTPTRFEFRLQRQNVVSREKPAVLQQNDRSSATRRKDGKYVKVSYTLAHYIFYVCLSTDPSRKASRRHIDPLLSAFTTRPCHRSSERGSSLTVTITHCWSHSCGDQERGEGITQSNGVQAQRPGFPLRDPSHSTVTLHAWTFPFFTSSCSECSRSPSAEAAAARVLVADDHPVHFLPQHISASPAFSFVRLALPCARLCQNKRLYDATVVVLHSTRLVSVCPCALRPVRSGVSFQAAIATGTFFGFANRFACRPFDDTCPSAASNFASSRRRSSLCPLPIASFTQPVKCLPLRRLAVRPLRRFINEVNSKRVTLYRVLTLF